MKMIFLSPHLDDAVYSCGGLIALSSREGITVEVWTVFAGDPQRMLSPFAGELHRRWGAGTDAVELRRREDRKACASLGAGFRHLNFPDCIYRYFPGTDQPVIQKNEDLFDPAPILERELVAEIAQQIRSALPERAEIYCPLALGCHIDHRITRAALESLGIKLNYYADFPYAAKAELVLEKALPAAAAAKQVELDEDSLQRWIAGVGQYRSQLSSFWQSEQEMAEALRAYSLTRAGSHVWTFV